MSHTRATPGPRSHAKQSPPHFDWVAAEEDAAASVDLPNAESVRGTNTRSGRSLSAAGAGMPNSGKTRDQVVTMLWGWLLIAGPVAGLVGILALLWWAWPD